MSIVEAVVAARKEMPPLVVDETATISGAKGSFKFKYAGLPGILEKVVPALANHGVLLCQDVYKGDTPRSIAVVTKLLLNENDYIISGQLVLETDGTPRDMAMKATSAKRLQLMSLLGLAASDDETETAPVVAARTGGVQAAAPPGRWVKDDHEARQKAAQRSHGAPTSPTLTGLLERCRATDDGDDMPVLPANGKTTSMYAYLNQLVKTADSGVTLSFLLGRVITKETPPRRDVEWLIHDLREGMYREELDEAYKLATGTL